MGQFVMQNETIPSLFQGISYNHYLCHSHLYKNYSNFNIYIYIFDSLIPLNMGMQLLVGTRLNYVYACLNMNEKEKM